MGKSKTVKKITKKAPPKALKSKKAEKKNEKKPVKQALVKSKPAPVATPATKPIKPNAKIKVEAKEKLKTPPVEPVEKEKKKANKSATVEIPVVPVVEEKRAEEEEVILTDADGRRYCRVQDCDQVAIVETYCRYHYLLYWKKIQYRKKILADNKFFKYIEELTAKYPDKFLEVIRKDLTSQKNFASAIQEMEIDESNDESDADDKSYMDDMRGIGAEAGGADDAGDDY